MGVKARAGQYYENSFMIIGNQNIYTLGALMDMVTSASSRIHLDFQDPEGDGYIFYRNEKTYKYHIAERHNWGESFIYGFTPKAMFVARIREMLKINRIQFDPEGDPKDFKTWNELIRLKEGTYAPVPFKTNSGKEIMSKDIKHEDRNLTLATSYVAVIDDERVTLTRQSGHTSTGVREAPAETLESVIERVKASAAGGGGAAKED